MQLVTYTELVEIHGQKPAYRLLLAVERLAQIRDDIASLDMNDRFDKALRALADVNFA